MRKRYCRAGGRSRASRKTGRTRGTRERVEGWHGSRSSRIAGFRGARCSVARPARAADAINDDALQRQDRFEDGIPAGTQNAGSRHSASVTSGSRQQDGQSMHVSSTCGADRMESLKDRKAGPGGVRNAQPSRLMRGIGSRRPARSANIDRRDKRSAEQHRIRRVAVQVSAGTTQGCACPSGFS